MTLSGFNIIQRKQKQSTISLCCRFSQTTLLFSDFNNGFETIEDFISGWDLPGFGYYFSVI